MGREISCNTKHLQLRISGDHEMGIIRDVFLLECDVSPVLPPFDVFISGTRRTRGFMSWIQMIFSSRALIVSSSPPPSALTQRPADGCSVCRSSSCSRGVVFVLFARQREGYSLERHSATFDVNQSEPNRDVISSLECNPIREEI